VLLSQCLAARQAFAPSPPAILATWRPRGPSFTTSPVSLRSHSVRYQLPNGNLPVGLATASALLFPRPSASCCPLAPAHHSASGLAI